MEIQESRLPQIPSGEIQEVSYAPVAPAQRIDSYLDTVLGSVGGAQETIPVEAAVTGSIDGYLGSGLDLMAEGWALPSDVVLNVRPEVALTLPPVNEESAAPLDLSAFDQVPPSQALANMVPVIQPEMAEAAKEGIALSGVIELAPSSDMAIRDYASVVAVNWEALSNWEKVPEGIAVQDPAKVESTLVGDKKLEGDLAIFDLPNETDASKLINYAAVQGDRTSYRESFLGLQKVMESSELSARNDLSVLATWLDQNFGPPAISEARVSPDAGIGYDETVPEATGAMLSHKTVVNTGISTFMDLSPYTSMISWGTRPSTISMSQRPSQLISQFFNGYCT